MGFSPPKHRTTQNLVATPLYSVTAADSVSEAKCFYILFHTLQSTCCHFAFNKAYELSVSNITVEAL